MKPRILQSLLVFCTIPVLVTGILGALLPVDWYQDTAKPRSSDSLDADRAYVQSLVERSHFVATIQDSEGNSLDLKRQDTRFAVALPGDWRGVGLDGQLNDELRAPFVLLSPAGDLKATLRTTKGDAAAGLNVYLMQSGRLVDAARTDANGELTINGLEPGVYSVIAIGEAGVAVFSASLVPYQDIEGYPIGFESLVVSAPYDFVLKTLDSDFPNMRDSTLDETKYVELAKPENEGDPAPAQFQGLREALRELPKGTGATNIQNHAALISADKTLWGRIIGNERVTGRPMLIDEMTIYLLSAEGEVASSAEVDNRGVFKLENIEAGNYGLMGAGADGFFITGIQTEQAPAAAAGIFTNEFFVGAQGDGGTTAVSPVTNPEDVQGAFNSEGGDGTGLAGLPLSNPPAAGPGGGGGGGGGGGAAGAGLAAAAIVGAAITQGDENNATPAGP
ncbi:MAG: carboxypeptidase-like regulatory domain-containing protein [Pirellulaceae bacterium]